MRGKLKEYLLLGMGVLFPIMGFFELMRFYSGDFLTPELRETISWGFDENVIIPIIISNQFLIGIILIITYINITGNGKEGNSHS